MHNQLLLVVQLERLLRRYNICILIIRILLISVQLCTHTIPPLKTSPSFKTLTYSNIRSHRGTYSATTSFILLLIPSTPSTTFSTTTTPTNTENIRVYLAIAVSIYINIVYKQVTKIVNDVQAIDCWLSKLKDSLSKIKDGLAFIRYSIIALIHNAGLLNIEFKQIPVGYCCRLAVTIG